MFFPFLLPVSCCFCLVIFLFPLFISLINVFPVVTFIHTTQYQSDFLFFGLHYKETKDQILEKFLVEFII